MKTEGFVPCYDTREMARLFKAFRSGGLDGIHSGGCAILGVQDCDRSATGFRPQTLIERFTTAEVLQTLHAMNLDHAVILLLHYWAEVPLVDIARAYTCAIPNSAFDSSVLGRWEVAARDEFMRRLLR